MRSLHLTLAVFCQVILTSYIFYLHSATASPVVQPKPSQPSVDKSPSIEPKSAAEKPIVKPNDAVEHAPVVATIGEPKPVKVEEPAKVVPAIMEARSAPINQAPKVELPSVSIVEQQVPVKKVDTIVQAVQAPTIEAAPAKQAEAAVIQPVVQHAEPVVKPAVVSQEPVVAPKPIALALTAQPAEIVEAVKPLEKPVVAPVVPVREAAPMVVQQPQVVQVESQIQGKSSKVIEHPVVPIVSEKPVQAAPVSSPVVELPKNEKSLLELPAPVSVVQKIVEKEPQQSAVVPPAVPAPAAHVEPVVKVTPVASSPEAPATPVVKGGLGPLHLLATTLCSYQPERPVADESLNLLYSQRAALRKSLFDFMSLKFTNLEKLSSKLNAGLEVMPRKTTDSSQSSVVPSHGWPVVGKCTAHDLKLMAEAAWCECDQDSACGQQASSKPPMPSYQTIESLDKQEPKIVGNKHQRRSPVDSAVDQSSAVVSRMLHVNDVKDAPLVESSLAANLNLTQQQLAAYQAQQQQVGSSRACRRQALRLTKALFNHLSEDQRNVSDSWPKLYAQVAEDDCARKRMIDIVTALSGFRGESTSIRRDNVEFAFAMDDLRTKVLESEVNQPLTFDKQFIEVEQFLQQSVKLMLANIDPERARLTSMRYRSLMPQPMSVDDQCIELHQKLLAKNYPTDCNPTQFGQLPDVLRMAANSLELWSIEKELSKHSSKIAAEYPMVSVASPPKQEVNECIANLVSS